MQQNKQALRLNGGMKKYWQVFKMLCQKVIVYQKLISGICQKLIARI